MKRMPRKKEVAIGWGYVSAIVREIGKAELGGGRWSLTGDDHERAELVATHFADGVSVRESKVRRGVPGVWRLSECVLAPILL